MNGRIQILVDGKVKVVDENWWFLMRGPKPPFNFATRGVVIEHDIYTVWPATRVFSYQQHFPPKYHPKLTFIKNLWTLLALQECPFFKRFPIIWKVYRASV